MAYTGNIPAEQYISTVKDTFNGDNTTTDFTLSRPSLANNLEVFVENVQQEPTTAYTVSGTTISFTSAPPTGTGNIYVIHRGQAVQTVVPPAGISVNATDLTVTGASALQDGLTVDNDGATVATFDRATSDGDIAVFQKDGSSVGSIASQSGANLAVGSGDTGLLYVPALDQILPHNMTTNATRDAAVDLGRSVTRFKDLYLSGGVYLGGTGAANYLDDYEEGTWSPTFSGTSGGPSGVNFNARYGTYTKIGNTVHITAHINVASWSSGPSGNLIITTLPFSTATNGDYRSAGEIGYINGFASNSHPTTLLFVDGTTSILLIRHASSDSRDTRTTSVSTADASGNEVIVFSATYITDA